MSSGNLNISDGTGAAVLAAMNAAFAALGSITSGTTSPADAVTGRLWLDTGSTPNAIKLYTGSSWLTWLTFGSSVWRTGDLKLSMHPTAETGWILCNGSIGNASSGATRRANADCYDLFVLLWDSCSNSACPVQDSSGAYVSRGASAASDWASNRRLVLPDSRGASIVGAGSGGAFETTFTADASTDILTFSREFGVEDGTYVTFTTSGSLPAGLPSAGYLVRVSSTSARVAQTLEQALMGSYLNLTSAGSGTHGATVSPGTATLGLAYPQERARYTPAPFLTALCSQLSGGLSSPVAISEPFDTGDVIYLVGPTVPSPATSGTKYYIIKLTTSTFKIATSYANAIAGTAVTLSGVGSTNCLIYGSRGLTPDMQAEFAAHTHVKL